MKNSGTKPYRIEYMQGVLERDVPLLPVSALRLIRKAVESRLTVDPIAYGKPLRHSRKGQWRLRVSTYRIIYTVDAASRTVFITAMGHRKEIYD